MLTGNWYVNLFPNLNYIQVMSCDLFMNEPWEMAIKLCLYGDRCRYEYTDNLRPYISCRKAIP